MQLKDIFSKRKKYATIPSENGKQDVPEGLMQKCPGCRKIFYRKNLFMYVRIADITCR